MTQSTMISSSAFADPNQAVLLQQLIDNPSLRSELEADPIATLGRFGIEMDSAEIPTKIELPSRTELKGALEAASTLAPAAKWLPFFG